ncbi:hypothetical protein BHG00_09675 [Corynebacterium ulcerans]|uniref:hypothetical protein n=1 Tax=Corynebacterium ulcerans TaxID=65058 RepID=UPI0003C7A27D|nr:hypothetical protein [Corynebacterium ulcerans]ESU59057.1 hypothetical protein D881_03285 [Corynebacterium ulcerans NCTC 12077]MBH5301394.1 hypothetical protein [Corynebacterium ulcerans]OIS05290.1 hypothetical protein BHG00_09675 [Corynebacterium ulcerans]
MTSMNSIKRVSHANHRIRAMWHQGKKIWPKFPRDIAPWCGLIMESHLASRRQDVFCSSIPAGQSTSVLDSNWENACIAWVLMRSRAEFALAQGQRKVFSAARSDKTLTISSISVNGKSMSAVLDLPNFEPVAVKLTMGKQWYGYWIQAEVFNAAGVSVAKKDVGNGGAFTKGETAFSKGEITATQSGSSFYAYAIGSASWWGNFGESSCLKNNMAVEVVKNKGAWLSSAFIPTDVLSIALYGGGQGGQGGGEMSGWNGEKGSSGGMIVAPSGVIGGVLTPGAGSRGGSGYAGYYGNAASPGGATTLDSLSTAGQKMKNHVVDGLIIPNFGLGAGGDGGSKSSDTSSGHSGSDGANGGLVAVYQWKNN